MQEVHLPNTAELEQCLAHLSAQEAVDYLNQMAEIASQKFPQRTSELARQAYERALRSGYQAGLAEACRLLGVGALFAGRYAEARTWFEQALTLFDVLGQREKVLHTVVNRALAYSAIGDYAEALEQLQQALDSGVSEFPALYLKALQNLGIVLAELGQYERALRTFEEVIAQATQQGSELTLARAYNNAALLLAARGEYTRALEYQQRSTALKEQQGDTYGLAVACGTLGYLYTQMGQWSEAERAYQQSLALRSKVGDNRGRGYVLANLGQLYRLQGMLSAAEEALAEAARIAEELSEHALQLEIARESVHLYQQRGDVEGTVYFLQRCLFLSEQLLGERVQQALARTEIRYETERQRREQEQLRRLLVEWQYRALQAQMNPHFLFNALNALQYCIIRNDVEAAQRFISRFTELMRRILRNSQRGLVSLREELETVELYLQIEHIRFCQAFSYLVEVSPEVDLDEIWIPSLLLQPLVENALKHGLGPRGGRGKVYIRVVEQQDHVLCCVEDDGVGRRADKSQEMAHTGSGLLLTEERLRLLSQHLGENFGIRIVDLVHPDGSPAGTRVELSLPLCIDYLRAGELLLAGLAPNSIKPVFSP